MRIGLVTSSYPASPSDTVTAGVFVRDLAYELMALGHHVHVLTPNKYGRIVPSDLNIYYIPWFGGEKDLASASMRNPLTLLRYASLVLSGLWNVSQYANHQNLDVLLAMWAIPSGLFSWVTWKWHGIPYGVWALGSDIWARQKYPLGDWIVRRILRDARFRFADGVRLARDVRDLVKAPCEFVPSVRKLKTVAKPQEASLPSGGTRFLFIGRYECNKGPDILVEAMRMVLDKGNRAHLYLFGVGSLEARLRERTKGYESYIHLGGYADPDTVIRYMTACDWLIIPSRIESIPLVFVDALQMHLPVIATEVGDMGALIRRFGIGQVVQSAAPNSLAVAMEKAVSISRADIVGAWDEALNVFDLGQSARKCIDALTDAQTMSSKSTASVP